MSLQRAARLQVPMLDVHSLVQIQLRHQPSRTMTLNGLFETHNEMFSHGSVGFASFWRTSHFLSAQTHLSLIHTWTCHMVARFDCREHALLFVCVCVTEMGRCGRHYFVSLTIWPSMCLTCLPLRYLGDSRKSSLSAEFPQQAKLVITFPWLPSFYSNPSSSGALWLYRAPVMVTGIANWLAAEKAAKTKHTARNLIEFLRSKITARLARVAGSRFRS